MSAKKVAVVTGASQGIGAGIAQAFRARGYAFDALLSIRDFGIEPPAK